MIGIILAIISGISMTLQGVFNTKVSEKIGTWPASTISQGIGFLLTLLILLIVKENINLKNIKDLNKLYLLGGILGVVIIYTVIESIRKLSTTCAISIILLAQLASAGLIDALGLFETPVIKFSIYKLIGVILMAAGIFIFKCKG